MTGWFSFNAVVVDLKVHSIIGQHQYSNKKISNFSSSTVNSETSQKPAILPLSVALMLVEPEILYAIPSFGFQLLCDWFVYRNGADFGFRESIYYLFMYISTTYLDRRIWNCVFGYELLFEFAKLYSELSFAGKRIVVDKHLIDSLHF